MLLDEPGQKRLYLRTAQSARMPTIRPTDGTASPVDMRLLCPEAIVTIPNLRPQPIQ